jgi:hypothetical protein
LRVGGVKSGFVGPVGEVGFGERDSAALVWKGGSVQP